MSSGCVHGVRLGRRIVVFLSHSSAHTCMLVRGMHAAAQGFCVVTSKIYNMLTSQASPNLYGCSRKQSHGRTLCVARSAPQATPTATAPVDPFATKTVYKDNAFDRFFIKIYSEKMAAQLKDVYVPPVPAYDDFVRISKEIMKGRSPEQQKDVVNNVLKSLLPPAATEQFRRMFPPTKGSAELNALFASQGFGWLVGEMEVKTGDIVIAPGQVRKQNSIVKIKKCRYLEASGCVGMCVNMCKVPTQAFFTNDFGLPLTMKPNFEDLSCEMIFGQPPEPEEVDAAFKQPCFKLQCNLSANEAQKACVKLPPV